MPKVVIWRDGAIEIEFDPGHRDWRIGRSETNDIALLDPRKSVSRFHAELREEHGRWVFIDLNSQNGSWKEGQRVNRLTLEHGHEVLFGDYRLAFVDVRVPPPPPVSAPDSTAGAVMATADVPIAPDATLLMPGKSGGPSPSAPVGAPPPVVRPAAKASPPRKGVNPVILLLFIIAMLAAVAAVAWRLLADRAVEPTVAEDVAPEPAPPPDPVPEVPPVPPPPAVDPGATAASDGAPGTPASAATAVPPAASPSTTSAAAVPAAPAGRTASARPKRAPAQAPPADNPAAVARYEDGRRALAAGRFAEAERAFQAVLSQQPGFRDAAARLQEARQGQQAVVRQRALAEAQQLDANGDWSRAVAAYERAGATAEADAARTKMVAAGDEAYRRARQFDARNRPVDAIPLYQRAVEWLPDSDPRKATAQERLAVLKGGGA